MLYKDVVEKIETWLKKTTDKITPSDKTIIKLYCQMVRDICKISKRYLEDQKDDCYWFLERNMEHLVIIRFKDTISKYEANRFKGTVAKTLLSAGIINYRPPELIPFTKKAHGWNLDENKNIWCELRADLFNKTPCMTVSLMRKIGANILKMEVQIQGNQYRRLISFPPFKFPEGRDKMQDKLSKIICKTDGHAWLFGPTKETFSANKWVGDPSLTSSMRNVYNKYKPDAIYQYVNISNVANSEIGLHFSALQKYILADVNLAINLLRDEKYIGKFARL